MAPWERTRSSSIVVGWPRVAPAIPSEHNMRVHHVSPAFMSGRSKRRALLSRPAAWTRPRSVRPSAGPALALEVDPCPEPDPLPEVLGRRAPLEDAEREARLALGANGCELRLG